MYISNISSHPPPAKLRRSVKWVTESVAAVVRVYRGADHGLARRPCKVTPSQTLALFLLSPERNGTTTTDSVRHSAPVTQDEAGRCPTALIAEESTQGGETSPQFR